MYRLSSRQDYQEHQQEIHAKLVAIMGDRLTAHCKTLLVSEQVDALCFNLTLPQTVDWNVRRDGVNDYMVVLVKETVTLHKVLSRYLQDTVLEVSK